MEKTEVKVSCSDQVLKITDAPVLAAGGLNEVRIVFDFCEKWAGFTKTATFYRDEEEVYYSVLDENNTCVVPWEVCYEEGTFYFGVFGEKDGIRRTSNVVKYKVKKGATSSDMIPSEPSPDVYDQIMAELSGIRAEKDDIVKEATKHNIASIEKTGTEGLVDTYTITFLDESTQTYTVTNGEKGDKGDKGDKGEKGDAGSGGGDMLASVYDPNGKKKDIFKAIEELTAEDVGARPNTWTPTAAQVGARPNTWTPSASEVGAVPTTRKVNNRALSNDIHLTASDIEAVPTTRTINGKRLSSDISIGALDIGARPNTWMPSASDVGAAPAASVAYIDKNDNETVILPPSGGDGGDSSPGSGGLTAEQVQAMIDAALGGIENGTY